MKKIYIKPVNEKIVLEESISTVSFNNVKMYRDFYYNTNEYIIFSEDNQVIDNKNILRIDSPLNLEINNKKSLTLLYKNLSKQLTTEQLDKFSEIQKMIFELIEDISFESTQELITDELIEPVNIFNLVKLCYKEPTKENYLETLILYLKIQREISDYKLIITFGLQRILDDNEIKLLKSELELLSINLVDIELVNKNKTNIDYLIDDDWCII